MSGTEGVTDQATVGAGDTRSRLLDATIQSLAEVGYARTTSRYVAEVAGISRGAQTHHFPHRLDLIAEAYEHLVAGRVAAMEATINALPAGAGVDGLLAVLWEDLSGPAFRAGTKVWIAASDDPELRARLLPVEERLRRVVRGAVARQAGVGADDPDLMARFDLCVTTLRGLALLESFEPRDRPPRRDRWAAFRPLLVGLVGGAR